MFNSVLKNDISKTRLITHMHSEPKRQCESKQDTEQTVSRTNAVREGSKRHTVEQTLRERAVRGTQTVSRTDAAREGSKRHTDSE